MADRVLTFSAKRCDGDPTIMLPAYFVEGDFTPIAVRIHAEDAPDVEDARFDILDDGVSIMHDHEYTYSEYIANTATYSGATFIELGKNQTSEEMAEDLLETPIEAGSWITCVLHRDGGGKNFTVVLELETLDEPDEERVV